MGTRSRWLGALLAAGVACRSEGAASVDSGASSGGSVSAAGADSGIGTGIGTDAGSPTDGAAPDGGNVEHEGPRPWLAPTFSPPAGTYNNVACVVISFISNPGATIYYTTDGGNPTTTSSVYAESIDVDRTMTIRAAAGAPGEINSAVAAGTYLITHKFMLAPVSFAPNGGALNEPAAVALSTTTSQGTICYRSDGLAPTCSAPDGGGTSCHPLPDPPPSCTGGAKKYVSGTPILVEAPDGGGSVVIKALACSPGQGSSDVTTATYTFP